MASDEPLLDIAAALADGSEVDWESAAESVASEDERRLVAELRFIAGVVRARPAEAADTAAPAADLTSPRTPGALSVSEASSDWWGPLKVIEHVGRGTFGDVYRAWDSRLDREVALKVLRRRERDDPAHASSVIEEGRLLARVRHPNVVTVYGAERINGQVGVWMEFVHGMTLEEELRDRGPFHIDAAIMIGIELADALSTVHRAGLIHRDVKAQNVLRDRDGRLVLTDFGAGCELQETGDSGAREPAGTPAYVAPEVLAGRLATPQSDVYSLGVLLYHLVTAAYPLRGRSLKEVREAHASGTRTPLAVERPDLPDAFVRIVDRALDPNPANRYETLEAMGSELASLRASALVGRADDVPGPRRWRWWLVPIVLALIAGVALWRAVGSDDAGRSGESPSTSPLNPEIELVAIMTATEQGRLEEGYERALRVRSAFPASAEASAATAYTLTYAGFIDEAAQAIDAVLMAEPDYIKYNGWWTPTALLYQQRFGPFLQILRDADTSSSRLYRALAEVERRRPADALAHLTGLESGGADALARLASALHAGLTGRPEAGIEMIHAIARDRRAAGNRDGEVTFKQAQILGMAGDSPSALTNLDEAVAQGFVCVPCFETSSLLERVRLLPGYQGVRERALARHRAFGLRFKLESAVRPKR